MPRRTRAVQRPTAISPHLPGFAEQISNLTVKNRVESFAWPFYSKANT
jgi:hypothetical protein